MFQYPEVLNVCLRSVFILQSSWNDTMQKCGNNKSYVQAKRQRFGMKNKLRGRYNKKGNSIYVKRKV